MALIWQAAVPPERPSMTARQRKQVFMTSNVFQAGSPTGTNMYDPAKQRSALSQSEEKSGAGGEGSGCAGASLWQHITSALDASMPFSCSEALRKAQLQRGTPRQVQAAALPRARDCKVTLQAVLVRPGPKVKLSYDV
eukprot:s4577_g4.t1